ncbi:thioredoxin, partial [Xanthomonas citri pv. citri]|nr:thioredoxin [Xanthomonas citri pv. citri]
GTPAFLINGKSWDGWADFMQSVPSADELLQAIKKAH